MKKEVTLQSYVRTWLADGTVKNRMNNPLDKTYKDFTFDDTVVACQFGNYTVTSPGESLELNYNNNAPCLFIGTFVDAASCGKLLNEDGKNYVVIGDDKFEIIKGAKFAPDNIAKQKNLEGEKVSNVHEVDFISKEIGMYSCKKMQGSSYIIGKSEIIGTRYNMPKSINLDKDVASVKFYEKLVGEIELSTRHNDPHEPDFVNVQKVQIHNHVDLLKEHQIGQNVTEGDLRNALGDSINITKEMEKKYYKMDNGNIRERNENKPLVSSFEINKIYANVFNQAKKSIIRERLAQAKGYKGESGIAKMERLAKESIQASL